MERLQIKMASASKALAKLREVTGIDEVPPITRDAAIQRFEFTFEAIWKVAKMYLKEIEGLEIGSPKGVLRACMQVGILSDEETSLGLEMVDDRNLTSHTYNEELAISIYERLDEYVGLLTLWLERIKKTI
jgi:nucleotidyltransferase substrate binding protein (TIGR01987 family)